MKRFLMLFAITATMAAASAEPIVIKDFGNTRPSGIPSQKEIIDLAKKMGVPQQQVTDFDAYIFPVMSEKMSLGKLAAPIKHDKKNISPFFIVGADTASQEWLMKNKQFLINSQVKRGLVTNVPNGEAFRQMSQAADPIKLYVLNTDDIADVFGVNVYPIVITQEDIQQ